MTMQMAKCPEYVRLQAEVLDVLEKLTKLTQGQLDAFRRHDQATVMRLDKELETTVGLKERRLGAMRQHAREHKCQAYADLRAS
jgi:hypothetical protein